MEGKDFYFQVIHQVSGTFFNITPKLYYDSEGCLSDESGVADEVVPKGFCELSESTYEYEGSHTLGRELLLQLGMIEIDFGFNTPATPMRDDNDDYEEFYPEQDDEDELDLLLKEEGETKTSIKKTDYKNTDTDKLLRHLKIMLMSESFEEAANIRDELTSRGETNF